MQGGEEERDRKKKARRYCRRSMILRNAQPEGEKLNGMRYRGGGESMCSSTNTDTRLFVKTNM